MAEIQITDFPGYVLTDSGMIFSEKRQIRKILAIQTVSGYQTVTLCREGKRYPKLLHRLVAEHFIPKSKKDTIVVFKDGDKSNCNYTNLKWSTKKEVFGKITAKSYLKRNKYTKSKVPGLILTSPHRVDSKEVSTKNAVKREAKSTAAFNKKLLLERKKFAAIQLANQSGYDQKRKMVLESEVLSDIKKQNKIRELTTVFEHKQRKLEKQHKLRLQKLKEELAAGMSKTYDTNRFFEYDGEFHKITDTGKSLIIRVKVEGTWKTVSVAVIILEKLMGKARPSDQHYVGFKDFDYHNLAISNLIWETPKEKADRYFEAMPIKKKFRMVKASQINKNELGQAQKERILKLLDTGKNMRQIARMTSIPYYTVYGFVKRHKLGKE